MNEGEILLFLNECKFRLGGSRRMAAKYPDSIHVSDTTDYDFYCSDCPEHIEILDDCGFEKVYAPDRTYWDSQLLEMYKHPDFSIEVLIRKDGENIIWQPVQNANVPRANGKMAKDTAKNAAH
jgi:hypothetical protein